MKKILILLSSFIVFFSFLFFPLHSAIGAVTDDTNFSDMVFIDVYGNMHRLDYIDSNRHDYYDEYTNQLIDGYKTVILTENNTWSKYLIDSINAVFETYDLTDSVLGVNTSIASDFENVTSSRYLDLIMCYEDNPISVVKRFNFSSDKENTTLSDWKLYLADNPITITYTLASVQTIQGRVVRPYITYAEYLSESNPKTIFDLFYTLFINYIFTSNIYNIEVGLISQFFASIFTFIVIVLPIYFIVKWLFRSKRK